MSDLSLRPRALVGMLLGRRRSAGRCVCRFASGPILALLIAGCGREMAAESAVASESPEETLSAGLHSPADKPSLEPTATNAEDQFDLQKILATKDEFGLAAIVDHERALLHLLLTTPSPEISISTKKPLSEVLATFSEAMNQQSKIPIRFAVDQTDPDIGEELQYLEDTYIGPLTINAGAMKISSALAEILSMVKDQELTWLIRNESIVITTVATAELGENLLLRSYDIGPLLRTGVSAKSIKTTVQILGAEAVEWTEFGGFGAIEVVGDHLIVQQTRPSHQKVFEIVERMRQGLESFDAHRSKRMDAR